MRRRPYHHGDLRRALVDAALALLAVEGLAALTVREVARRAGVSHTAAFYHFRTRDELLAALGEHGFVELRAAIERAARRRDTARAALGRLGETYVRFALARPWLYRLMFAVEAASGRAHQPLATAAEAMFEELVQAMARAQAAGVVRAGEPAELALAAWSAAHGIASLLIDRPLGHTALRGRSATELARVALDSFARGARPG
jgi:AcrR family transcriptional regulator